MTTQQRLEGEKLVMKTQQRATYLFSALADALNKHGFSVGRLKRKPAHELHDYNNNHHSFVGCAPVLGNDGAGCYTLNITLASQKLNSPSISRDDVSLELSRSLTPYQHYTFLPSSRAPLAIGCDYSKEDIEKMYTQLIALAQRIISPVETIPTEMRNFRGRVGITHVFRYPEKGDNCRLEMDPDEYVEKLFPMHIWQEKQGHYCISQEYYPIIPGKLDGIKSLNIFFSGLGKLAPQRVAELLDGMPISRNSDIIYQSSISPAGVHAPHTSVRANKGFFRLSVHTAQLSDQVALQTLLEHLDVYGKMYQDFRPYETAA